MAKYDKERLLADYHTGLFSQRELARKYGVSNGTVANLTNGLPKKNEQLLSKKVEVIQESRELTDIELSAIEHGVQFKLDLLKDIEHFSNKAMQKAKELIDNADTGADFNAVVNGVDKLSILTKINDRHAKPAQIQQNTQNNVSESAEIKRIFHVVE